MQLPVQLIQLGNTRRYLQLDDLLVANIIQIFDQRPQAIPVGRYLNRLPSKQRRCDIILPEREDPRDRQCQ